MTNRTKGARMALRLAQHIQPENLPDTITEAQAAEVSDLLLGMSLEGDAWYRAPDFVFVPEVSTIGKRLARGPVTQAETVALHSTDADLLLRMARSDRRRAVRYHLAMNAALPQEAVPLLWAREREDAGKSGANPRLLGMLLARMTPAEAIEAYIDGYRMGWTDNDHPDELARSLASVLGQGEDRDIYVTALAEIDAALHDPTAFQFATERHWWTFDHAQRAVYWLTGSVLLGNAPISRSDWLDLVAAAGDHYLDVAGQAAWVAAQEEGAVVDEEWARFAVHAFSWAKPYRDLKSFTSRSTRPWFMTDADEYLPEQIQDAVGRNAGVELAMQLLRSGKSLPAPMLRALLHNPHSGPAWAEQLSHHHVEQLRGEDDVVALLDRLGTRVLQNWRTLSSVLRSMPLSRETQKRLVCAESLGTWLSGVNCPTQVEVYTDVVSGIVTDGKGMASAVSSAFRDGRNSPMHDYVWRNTPGLPAYLAANTHPGLHAATTRYLLAELGADTSSWDVVLRLLPDWQGTFGELLDVSAAL